MDVGFIGVGSMGAAMVPNLVRAGHRVSVWNRNKAAAEALEGVAVLASPAAAFESDAVLTMLSDDAAVRSVIVSSGVLAAAEIVRENMQQAVDQGLGAKDWSILAKTTRRRAGLDEGVA